MAGTNFLIGRGELLTHAIEGPKRPHEKAEAYTLAEAIDRLGPQLATASSVFDDLPKAACPGDLVVATIALNPGYIAKSYFPGAALQAFRLQAIGSRAVKITPEKWTRKGPVAETTTTELFVAGERAAFRALPTWSAQLVEGTLDARDFTRFERIAPLVAADRIKDFGTEKDRFFEVGLHLLPDDGVSLIQSGFSDFARAHEVVLHHDLSFRAGSLWFVPVEGEREHVRGLAQFTFVRALRVAPRLRSIQPLTRSGAVSVSCTLPTEGPVSSEPRVAVLDGGLPDKHDASPWVRSYRKLDEDAQDDPDGPSHGLGVTSALLFGPLSPGKKAERPYSFVDHFRVLDSKTAEEDPLELYRTLGHIEQVLLTRQYEFLNLSLGPSLPVEDSDVHAWTSVIDEFLSDGETLISVAAGNNGDKDRASGNARIQVPGDCVNAVVVGACDDTAVAWERADYSALGPGRSPGVIKPDLLAFGGTPSKYFHVLNPIGGGQLLPTCGTSFASPLVLRQAVGIRAILGADLSPLALKALLVHSAESDGKEPVEVGWGRVSHELEGIITSQPGVARIVYQGVLTPGKYLRAAIPLPPALAAGNVRIKATFCYASRVDPQDTASYTRAGLEVHFRPNAANIKKNKLNKDKKNAETKGFFELKKFATEADLRSDIGKWETVLHAAKTMRNTSLNSPAFDIHYNAREGGGPAPGAKKIRYALVVTVEAPKHPNLYTEILGAHSVLVSLEPKITLPVRT